MLCCVLQAVLSKYRLTATPSLILLDADTPNRAADTFKGDINNDKDIFEFGVSQLPNIIEPVSAEGMNMWLQAPGLPRLLALTRKAEPSPLLRAVARDLEGKFVVGELRNPPDGTWGYSKCVGARDISLL